MSKILLVDDNATLRSELRNFLKSLNYEVDDCLNGVLALEKLKKNQYDLVITDYQMPGISGSSLIPVIKKTGAKIIFISASFSKDVVVLGKKDGANKFLTKPFSMTDFENAVVGCLYDKLMEEESLNKVA